MAFPTTLGSEVTTAPVQEAKVAQRNRACAAPERGPWGLKDLGKGWVDGWVEKSKHVGIYIVSLSLSVYIYIYVIICTHTRSFTMCTHTVYHISSDMYM